MKNRYPRNLSFGTGNRLRRGVRRLPNRILLWGFHGTQRLLSMVTVGIHTNKRIKSVCMHWATATTPLYMHVHNSPNSWHWQETGGDEAASEGTAASAGAAEDSCTVAPKSYEQLYSIFCCKNYLSIMIHYISKTIYIYIYIHIWWFHAIPCSWSPAMYP